MEATILARAIEKDEVIERGRVLIDNHGLPYVVIMRYKPWEDGRRRYMLAYLNDPQDETFMYVEALIDGDGGWKITPYGLDSEYYEILIGRFAEAVVRGFIPVDIDEVDDVHVA